MIAVAWYLIVESVHCLSVFDLHHQVMRSRTAATVRRKP